MKLDELEKMAQQTAAFGVHPSGEFIYSFYTEQLQAFAQLIAEHERERIAKKIEQCEWVGLTDKEIGEIAVKSQDGICPHDDTLRFARAIEVKLKEKNEKTN